MARIVDRPVAVTVGRDGSLRAFVYQGRQRITDVLDTWKEVGQWWDGEGERTTYRVATDRGGLFELSLDHATKRWWLYKVYD